MRDPRIHHPRIYYRSSTTARRLERSATEPPPSRSHEFEGPRCQIQHLPFYLAASAPKAMQSSYSRRQLSISVSLVMQSSSVQSGGMSSPPVPAVPPPPPVAPSLQRDEEPAPSIRRRWFPSLAASHRWRVELDQSYRVPQASTFAPSMHSFWASDPSGSVVSQMPTAVSHASFSVEPSTQSP